MNRDESLKRIRASTDPWDVLVIGGGATGLGTAVDAAARGYRTLLVEQSDFAKATSSRSTKLIHGGIRYLRHGDFHLVRESLQERQRLLQNASHLVRPLPFLVPSYAWWQGPYYAAGLKLYDVLAGRFGIQNSRRVSRDQVLKDLPTLQSRGLRGGIRYFDGQFDDARLAVCLARTLDELGGVPVNYFRVESLLRSGGRVHGVAARDLENSQGHEIPARVVINATGVFADAIRRMDSPEAAGMLTASQGAHLVLDRSFLPGDCALMIPQTDDGRILFAIPWHGRTLVGTTGTSAPRLLLEPRPLRAEIDFLLSHAGRYLDRKPAESDILSAFAGLRPLVSARAGKNTAGLSRSHTLLISDSGLVTITGGKWTTYRKMAEDTVDAAARAAGLPARPSPTKDLPLHGWSAEGSSNVPPGLETYGTDAKPLLALIRENPEWEKPIHSRLPGSVGEWVWSVRQEMARSVEDVLARRTRALLLDARAAVECAPAVARLMAAELGRDERWQKEQVAGFRALAEGHLPQGCVP